MKKAFLFSAILTVLLSTATALAAETPAMETVPIDTGDTAFVLASAGLVMLMTPRIALFYGGMVRSKNALTTIMQSFFLLGLISVQWVLFGYSLAFGPDVNHLIGNLNWAGFAGVGMEANTDYAATIPHAAFAMFQAMFAVLTPALITGACGSGIPRRGNTVRAVGTIRETNERKPMTQCKIVIDLRSF